MARRASGRRPARARALLALSCISGLQACSGPPGAGRQLGDDLGGFHVAAMELTNGCGAGALGSRPSFDFEIDLARESTQIFWGRSASGPLDAQLGFEFSATVRVAVAQLDVPAEDGIPSGMGGATSTSRGCTIERSDHISGTLQADADGEVVGFSARMSYSFEPARDSSCSLDERIAAGLPRLPCVMDYALAAERTRNPD